MNDSKTMNIIYLLRTRLKLRISNEVITQSLFNNPNYPSIPALSDFFNSINIKSLTVKIGFDQLNEIPLPSIAHLKINGQNRLVIFDKIDNEKVTFTDQSRKTNVVSFQELSEFWSGVTILLDANDPYDEENYIAKRKKELIEERISLYSILFLGVVLFSLTFFLPAFFNIIFLLKLVGLALSMAILQRQLGYGSELLDGFCGKNETKNCDEVINAEEAKLFGIFNLSEITIIFFTGGILSLSLFPLVSAVSGYNFAMTCCAVLSTFFTLFYQWRVIKKWCMLCLGLTAIFWLELALYFPVFEKITFSVPGSIITLLAFLAPFTVWVNIRERYFYSFEIPKTKRRLNRFLQSEQVFENLLKEKKEAPSVSIPFELHQGNESAPVTITLVSKPSCKYCATTHDEVEKLINKFRDNLQVNYRFFVQPASRNSISYNVISRILGLQMSRHNDTAIAALSDWYSVKNANQINSWEEKYQFSESIDQELIHDIISRHHEWCVASNVTHTPMIFFNGKPLPEEFSIKDIDYHIRKIIEKK